jgi:hypothetical protein
MTTISSSRGAAALVLLSAAVLPASAAQICQGFGAQTPRDISSLAGTNPHTFEPAPPAEKMNLCNIHTHTPAEHKGPGFSLSAGEGEHGGYRCNATDKLTEAELEDPAEGHGGFHGVAPGDSIEVHWVYTTCDVVPGEGLGACMTETCADPSLRVESQVFLVVNDQAALDFDDFSYGGNMLDGLHQPWALPSGTGDPVVFAGSTTGPRYSEAVCSPYQVTWSVRPECARLDISSLHEWGEGGNIFNETHSHGIRRLVTAPELLSPIE